MNIGTIGTGEIVEKIITNIQKTSDLKCSAIYSRSLEKDKCWPGSLAFLRFIQNLRRL